MENSLLPPDSETSFTFLVDPVDLCEEAPYMSPVEDILRKKILTIDNKTKPWDPPYDFTGKFEDCSHRKDMNANFISPDIPGMIAAIHAAFQSHYALSLSASDFIVLIGQGLGAHINKNAEKLRKYFVDHEGKDRIIVDRDDFGLGGQNDWSTVFGEFAEQIKKRVKADVYDMIVDDTSVATPTSRIVSEITLMEAMKGYFSYDVFTSCGIPQITLEGKREDWQKLKDKVGKLVEMNKDDCLDLNWWLDKLVPVVDKICEAGIDREVDEEFWENIYKYCGGSGGDRVNGWITRFFPYVSDERNKFRDERSAFGGIGTSNIPRQVSEVPFMWIYLGKEIPMKFTAGFLGAEFNKELCQVKPAYFWCVTPDEEKKS